MVSIVLRISAVAAEWQTPWALVFSVNYFCRPIASPKNVTEILALISHPNQD